MKLNIALILYFFAINLFGTEFEFEGDIQFTKPYLFVSLGCNCWQAQAMRSIRAHGLRDAAFPFDWLFSLNNNGLVKCLNENFENFFNESYIQRYNLTYLDNTYYDFKFTHDWPFYDLNVTEERHIKQLEYIKKKYTRRIKRFRNLNSYNGKVFFIRCFQTHPDYKGEWGWNAQNACNLNEALKRFFPNLNFTLVVVSCTDAAISEIGNLEGVKEYKISDLINDNFAAYDIMFKELLAMS